MRLICLSLADFLPLQISRIFRISPLELGDFLLSFYEDFLSLVPFQLINYPNVQDGNDLGQVSA
jgi:hypothetical protein